MWSINITTTTAQRFKQQLDIRVLSQRLQTLSYILSFKSYLEVSVEVANGILHFSWKALRFILCLCCARTEEGHSGLAFSHVFGKTFWNPSYILAILRGSSVHFHNFQNIGTKMLSVLTTLNQQSFLLVKTTVNNIDLSFWILVGISLATYFTESCIVLQTNSKAFTTTGSFVGSCWYLHGRRKKKRALNSFLLL